MTWDKRNWFDPKDCLKFYIVLFLGLLVWVAWPASDPSEAVGIPSCTKLTSTEHFVLPNHTTPLASWVRQNPNPNPTIISCLISFLISFFISRSRTLLSPSLCLICVYRILRNMPPVPSISTSFYVYKEIWIFITFVRYHPAKAAPAMIMITAIVMLIHIVLHRLFSLRCWASQSFLFTLASNPFSCLPF